MKCRFSKQTLEFLSITGVEYSVFDILENEKVWQGLKSFSNWPSVPQLRGGLVQQLDTVEELKENSELLPVL